MLVLECDGSHEVGEIEKQIRYLGLKATLHWNKTNRRIVLPVEGEIEGQDYACFVRAMGDAFALYFHVNRKDPTPLPGGDTQEFEGKTFTVDDLKSFLPKAVAEEDEGLEVPGGIDLIGQPPAINEVGDVRACDAPGFIPPYLNGSARGLERLAGVVGQIVVRHNDGFWVRSSKGSWTASTQGAAIGRVKSVWRSEFSHRGVRCKSRHIEELFRRSLLPIIDGTLTSPVAADFVEYQGGVYLNQRLAPRLGPTALGEDGRLIRTFVLQAVLNDQRSFSEIECELADPKVRTATRWALHWLAHVYQKPGIALPTALWLISITQGVGKTLFASMLSELVGRRNAVHADQAEMAGEWSDWLVGPSLIIADEINVVEKKSFYARQKSWIGSRSISVRRRGVGTWEIPSIANWLFLTNDLQPIRIDGADRRNMLIESTNDLTLATAAIERLKPILDDPARFRSALAEFGAWLDRIAIDNDLIRRAVTTRLKEDLIESTRDAVDTFVIHQVETKAWAEGGWLSTDALRQRYFAWCDHTEAFRGYKSQTHLVNGLKKLKARGWVCDKRTPSARGWVMKNVPIAAFVEPADGVHEVVDIFGGDTMKKAGILERMRASRSASLVER